MCVWFVTKIIGSQIAIFLIKNKCAEYIEAFGFSRKSFLAKLGMF